MDRADPSRWDKRIPLTFALNEETGELIYAVKPDAQEITAALARMSDVFSFAMARPYVESKDKDKLVCPDACCKARPHFVMGGMRDGNPDNFNRSHFRVARVEDHADACKFKNEKSESVARKNLHDAIWARQPILVNIDTDCGYRSFKPSRIFNYAAVNWYEKIGWKPGTEKPIYHTESTRSLQDILDLAKEVDSIGGEEALNLLYFQHEKMVLSYKDFWKALHDTDLQAQDVAMDTLKTVAHRGKHVAGTETQAQGPAHLIEFEIKGWDAENNTLIGQTFTPHANKLDSLSVIIKFLAPVHIKNIMAMGQRVLFMGAPALESIRDFDERRKTDHLLNGTNLDPARPIQRVIKYLAGKHYGAQFAPVPERLLFDMSVVEKPARGTGLHL